MMLLATVHSRIVCCFDLFILLQQNALFQFNYTKRLLPKYLTLRKTRAYTIHNNSKILLTIHKTGKKLKRK